MTLAERIEAAFDEAAKLREAMLAVLLFRGHLELRDLERRHARTRRMLVDADRRIKANNARIGREMRAGREARMSAVRGVSRWYA